MNAMDTYDTRPSWRDSLAYLLAYTLWAVLSGVLGIVLLILRSAVSPLFAVLLARNPYYFTRTVELRGVVNSLDRLFLIVFAIMWVVYLIWAEEYFRTAVAKARERRLRARISPIGESAPETRLQHWSLDLLPRRVAIATAFPAVAMIINLLLQGLFWLLVRA